MRSWPLVHGLAGETADDCYVVVVHDYPFFLVVNPIGLPVYPHRGDRLNPTMGPDLLHEKRKYV